MEIHAHENTFPSNCFWVGFLVDQKQPTVLLLVKLALWTAVQSSRKNLGTYNKIRFLSPFSGLSSRI